MKLYTLSFDRHTALGCVIAMLLAVVCPLISSAKVIRGEVTDSITGEPLPYVNVYFPKSKGGTLTDANGVFEFSTNNLLDSLRISSLGYIPKVLPARENFMTIKLSPATKSLAEVIIRPKKEKYSKKGNPAVALMERLRASHAKHDPRLRPFYKIGKHEKMALGLNNFKYDNEPEAAKKKFSFLKEYVDTSSITGLPFLSLIVKERLADDLYSENHSHKEIVRATRSTGIDDAFDKDNISTMLVDAFREVDINANDISLLQNRFVSPLSNIGANYYKYYITDTLEIDGAKHVELTFVPHNPESMGFNGRMYIPAEDSIPYVRKLVMRVPASINLNYVRNMYIIQDNLIDNEGYIHKKSDIMAAEFQLIPGTQTFYAERKTFYGNQSYIDNTKWDEYFLTGGECILDIDAENRDSQYWEENRLIPLSDTEKHSESLITRLRKVPLFYWSEKILSILVQGYVKTGKESKVDLGPVNTLVSYNTVEGVRLRVGGMTTANLSRRIFGRTYVAYGFRDKRFKYRLDGEFSLIDKKYHFREFPVNGFRLTHMYDYDMIGQHYLFTNPDNVFLSWKRKHSDKVTMRRLSQLSYIYENANGWSLETAIRHERQKPTLWLPFSTSTGSPLSHYNTTSLFIKIRFAPGEKFYQAKSDRLPVNLDAPVIQLTHEYGPKGLFGSDFEINKTELSLQKRFWFSAFGYTDIILKGGIIWSSVYFPSLMWGNANLSYTIQPESYSLMNPMEFPLDHYASWDITYWGNGILFNRIPLIKKLRLREVITFKGLWGGLNKRNNPSFNTSLLEFPQNTASAIMSGTPYMELSAGIDNILTILRVDYVWRLTYRNAPGIDHSGVRISLHFQF